jgi:hypothetical protein
MNKLEKTETAFKMNLRGFEKLIGLCTDLGNDYKPEPAHLKLPALNKLREDVRQVNQHNKKCSWDFLNALKERSLFAQTLNKLGVDIVNSLPKTAPKKLNEGAESDQPEVRGARKAARKAVIDALRQKPPFLDEVLQLIHPQQETGTASNLQQVLSKQPTDLISLAENLAAYEEYKPVREEVHPDALRNLAAKMQEQLEVIATTQAAKVAAATEREELYYSADTGLVAVANAVKEYILSTFDPTHRAYRLASVILFKDMRETDPHPA